MRTWIAGAFAVLVTAGVVGGVAWLLYATGGGPTREEQAAAVASTYADAWSEGDWDAMAALVIDPPEGFPDVHARFWNQLDVIGADVEVADVRVDRGRADADLDVTLTLGGVGDWTYPTTITMLRHEDDWRVEWDQPAVHPDLRDNRTFARRVDEHGRAAILAHDGRAITEPGELREVGLHPARIEDPDWVADAFDEHTHLAADDVYEVLDRDDLRDEWFYPLLTLREDEGSTWELLRPVPGIVSRTAPARLTPSEGFARHVVGVVDEITAELLDELGDPYQRGDQVGRFGLERVFEEQLRGAPGAEILLVDTTRGDPFDEDGEVIETRVIDVVHRFDEQAPEPVRTTLDVEVQTAVEEALEDVDDPAALVVVDVDTGAIRASASRPLAEFNRAFAGRYPPGSSFKIVTAATLVEAGLRPDHDVDCPAETTVGGLRIRNADELDLGGTTLEEAFAWSCNTTFATLGADLDGTALEAGASSFGFGVDYRLPLSAFGGSFPEPGDAAERGAAAIGQARVEASPLHLATVAAAIASGTWRAPHLLDGEAADASHALDADVADTVADLMRRVVVDGTGTAAQIAGGEVAGKTGSAEFGDRDEEGRLPTHAWFVGFHDGLAFAVLVEGGGAGGEVAAPLAARFLAALDGATD